MTRSIYIIGGAGTGKSTFTSRLLELLGLETGGDLLELHSKPNAKVVVTLRGHELLTPRDEPAGLYLGVMRDSFPGSDGLDRATSPTGAEWLRTAELPSLIISEGATLATRPFLSALHETTELLLVHLLASPEEVQRRFAERGSNQDPKFVLNTVTRSANLDRDMRKLGARVLAVWTENETTLEMSLDICVAWALQTAETGVG